MHAGETLGHYRIIDTLGRGGMGEVYAAQDTKLDRTVALKILPAVFAADPAFRERFEREARAVAALNHPNIVTIYSVEEDSGRPFLTMERVDGAPLNELMARGVLPLDRILRIGIEVADAMAAAQQRGITHRDLKPANIMIAADGRAKVLDFGLAKVRDAQIAEAGDQVTRMSRELTGEGKILGTVAYMSPEQAEGKAVDPRSDIFSLGVVLHEMATGERPFKGDTNVSIISSIIKDTPRPITDANPALPTDLARIVRRCLAKDPSRRYQTAADVRNELEELKHDTAARVSATGLSAAGVSGVAVPPSRAARSRFAWVGVAGAGLAVAALALFLVGRGRTLAPLSGFTIDHIERLTTTGTAYTAAISPDGRYVVHAKAVNGLLGLWTRQTATTSDVQIVAPATDRFRGITISGDGNYVYYNAYPEGASVATLFKVPVLGGTPVKLVDNVDSRIAFSPDQKRFAFTRGSVARGTTDLLIASADGSDVHLLVTSSTQARFGTTGLSWSPDGKTILVPTTPSLPTSASRLRRDSRSLIEAVNVDRGSIETIGRPWADLDDVEWLTDGRSFLVTGMDSASLTTQVWRVSYPSGERTRVTNDLNDYAGLSVSSDGRLIATVQGESESSLYLAQGPDKEPRRVTMGAGRADGLAGLDWTPDGRLVYSSTASGSPSQIWIADEDGSNPRRLTTSDMPAMAPRVSPDGASVYFLGFEKDAWSVFRIAPDGSGLQRIAPADTVVDLLRVSPDGKTIYIMSVNAGVPAVMKISTAGGSAQQVSKGIFAGSDVSPDGTHALGATWDAQRQRFMPAILNVDTGEAVVDPGPSRFRFYLPDGRIATLDRVSGKSIIRVSSADGAATAVTPPNDEILLFGAASRDGRIAFSRGLRHTDVVLITVK